MKDEYKQFVKFVKFEANKCKQNSIENRNKGKKGPLKVKNKYQRMVILDYNHAFTLKQLQVIITHYLQLGPYYQSLQKVIRIYMSKYSTLPLQQRHNQQHQHPIKLPINYYNYNSRQSAMIDKDSYSGDYEYIYPLQVLVQIMQSSEFYQQLPHNIIVNNLLTTTNINVIVETLTILSQSLSKLIKTTLNSVEDKKVTEFISTLMADCFSAFEGFGNVENSQKQDNVQVQKQKQNEQAKNQFNTNAVQNVDSESDLQSIRISSDFQISKTPANIPKFARKSSIKESIIAKLFKKQDLSEQNPKNVLKNLKTLLIEDQNLRPLWLIGQEEENNLKSGESLQNRQLQNLQKAIAIKPKQFTACQYCRNYRSYIIESTGLSYFDLHEISRIPSELYKVLRRIKDIVNVFTLYLKETCRTTVPAKINVVNKIIASIDLVITDDVWENGDINPSIKRKPSEVKKVGKKVRPLINQIRPYFDQVYNYRSHDQSQFTIDQLIKLCLKGSELKDVEKTLIEKRMNEARLKKEGRDIETLCLTKQNLINNNHSASNYIIGETSLEDVKNADFQTVIDEIQLLREYEKQQVIINRAVISSKPIYTQINTKYQDQLTIGTQIRRHKMDSNRASQNKQGQKSQNIKDIKKHNEEHENEKFKVTMYQHYLRSQGFNVSKNNISGVINKNLLKAKSMNCLGKDTENSIDQSFKRQTDDFNIVNSSQLTKRTLNATSSKTEQDGPTSYEKKQTEVYNKMLLNGETIRSNYLLSNADEVQNDEQFGHVVIYESMKDFLNKLDQMNVEVEKEQREARGQGEDKMEIFEFLTMCNPIMRKSSLGIKKTQNKKQDSSKFSRKTDLLNATKTPKSSFQTHLKSDATNKIQSQYHKEPSHKQVSINDLPFQGWTENVQIKKPDWLDQFVSKTGQQNFQMKKSNKTQKLQQNQRFKEFQQKCLLRQCLSVERLKDKDEKHNHQAKSICEEKKLQEQKTMTNLQRPVSAFCRAPKNATGKVKSLGRTLRQKRSYIMGKQFEIEYNSLLTKIYKQNVECKDFGSLKREIQQEKVFENFKNKIEMGKFTVDKFLS